MAKNFQSSEMSDALAAPLGELIAAVGRGLAEAQQSLDQASIETMKAIASGDDKTLNIMRRFGYQPTWYKIPELTAEMNVSLTVSGSSEAQGSSDPGLNPGAQLSGPGRIKLYVAPMDANYTNRYDYNLSAASSIKFKIVPVPPSVQAAEVKVVPSLVGKPFRDARALLRDLGVPYDMESTPPTEGTPVKSTTPAGGELLPGGERVVLSF